MRASDFEEKQNDVLEFISKSDEVPAIRELADHFEVAPATMHSWLSKLKDLELVEWEQGKHRSLKVTPKGSRQLKRLAKR